MDGCCTRFVDVESGILIINFRGEIETLVGFDVQLVHGSWAVRLKRMDGWFNGREAVWRRLVFFFFFSFLLRCLLSLLGIDLDSRVIRLDY